jgi:hypothetical protein
MFPAVAEVVEVFERSGADILQHIDKPGLAGIERSITEVRIGHAPADVACPDFVEMAARPAHGRLQHKVQAIQADRQWDLEPAHDGRFNIVEFDPQVGDRGGGHPARLQLSDGRGQCQGSARAAARGGGTLNGWQCVPTRRQAKRAGRHYSVWL